MERTWRISESTDRVIVEIVLAGTSTYELEKKLHSVGQHKGKLQVSAGPTSETDTMQ